jgi:hypothetical protein
VQPQAEIRDLPGGSRRRVPGARAALAELRRHHLLDQVGLPVSRRLDRPQVPGLHPVLTERGDRTGDRERLRAVLPTNPADQAVVLEFGQLLVVDSRRLEQLAPGHVGRSAPRPTVGTQGPGSPHGPGIPGPVGGAAGEPFPDDLQRKVRVPLHGQDVAQPVDVLRREPAVTRSRPGRLDQPLGLQEADLGRADVGKFGTQLRQHLADTELAARGLIAHARSHA